MKKRKRQLYWGFQIAGWGTFTTGNLIFNLILRGKLEITDWIYTSTIFITGLFFSHFIRFVFKIYDWNKCGITEILHKLVALCGFIGLFNISLLYFISAFYNSDVLYNFELGNFLALSASFATVYFIWGILYFIIYFFRNFKKEEIKNLQQQTKMNEIQLNKFKSQLNPHFIFNSMNGIRSLIDEDTQKAKEGITQLSNILRHTLSMEKKRLIHLDEELKLVADYLNLEKIRLEERLEFKINKTPECQHYQVPPMLIQTLVENAIKHGISQLIKGGEIIIDCTEKSNKLNIQITNTGQYTPNPQNQEGGYGLENSKQRLNFIFGENAQFEIRNKDNQSVITELTIPKT